MFSEGSPAPAQPCPGFTNFEGLRKRVGAQALAGLEKGSEEEKV